MKLRSRLALVVGLAILFASQPVCAQFAQQGVKLVGSGAAAPSLQGDAISLSADGNTVIIGGRQDNGYIGAAWIWVRSDGVWSQQGPKLVGSGGTANSQQGCSVGLSADGNTAIVGGWLDDDGAGAAWIFTRSGGVWSQQGPKLVAPDTVRKAHQGISVAISGDGDTAIVGGNLDGAFGAAWVWKRNGGVWSRQGAKLVGTDSVNASNEGFSVALSGDGSTAIVGGPQDGGSPDGAAWIWTRSGDVWTQQGPKLIGSGGLFVPGQGVSVGLSADGNTAIVGGMYDNVSIGAAWVWTRSGGVWKQQGPKLVGSGFVGRSYQGVSVSLSADGNTALIGGYGDASFTGGAWVFRRTGSIWTQQGDKILGSAAVGSANQGISVDLSADGMTAIVGGFGDDAGAGAAWVFTARLLLPRRHR